MQNEFGEIVKKKKKKTGRFWDLPQMSLKYQTQRVNSSQHFILGFFIPQIPIQDLNQIELKTKRSNPKHSEEFNKVQPRVDRYLSFVHSGRHHLLFVFRWDVQRWRHT